MNDRRATLAAALAAGDEAAVEALLAPYCPPAFDSAAICDSYPDGRPVQWQLCMGNLGRYHDDSFPDDGGEDSGDELDLTLEDDGTWSAMANYTIGSRDEAVAALARFAADHGLPYGTPWGVE